MLWKAVTGVSGGELDDDSIDWGSGLTRINACSRQLHSDKIDTHNRALIYYNRGNAYRAAGDSGVLA